MVPYSVLQYRSSNMLSAALGAARLVSDISSDNLSCCVYFRHSIFRSCEPTFLGRMQQQLWRAVVMAMSRALVS